MSAPCLTRTVALAGLLAVALGACAAPSPLDHPARFYDGVSSAGRAVSTASADAQAWFDQGLTLAYGFNHDEATRSFHAATLADPQCCMAWWGLALASGIDLNDPMMSEEDCRRAHAAAQQALATRDGATPVEAALAEAIATRYAWPAPDDRAELDQAYADAMQTVHERFPDDPDVAALYAEALMCLQPWDYWEADGSAKGRVLEAVEALERARERHPDHAGACHFLIHAVEAGQPERGEDAADRLAGAVPGAGHLLHMPSHIYVHLGRYADAADCNDRAVAADQAYFAAAPSPGFYTLYYAHNEHMLAFAAMMEGREEAATAAAQRLVDNVPAAFIEEAPQFADGIMATPLHVAVRFGRWQRILDEPRPPAWRALSLAQWHYARGVALSALGRVDEARVEQAAFEEAAERVPEDWRAGANGAHEVLGLARQMIAGELLWRAGETEAALEALREGVRLEDELVYDEPPGWMQPVRHALGAILLAAGRPAEAESVYREDLVHNPRNGWALLGLMQALSAQGQDGPAQTVSLWLLEAWKRADAGATSSCFCEPGGAPSA